MLLLADNVFALKLGILAELDEALSAVFHFVDPVLHAQPQTRVGLWVLYGDVNPVGRAPNTVGDELRKGRKVGREQLVLLYLCQSVKQALRVLNQNIVASDLDLVAFHCYRGRKRHQLRAF